MEKTYEGFLDKVKNIFKEKDREHDDVGEKIYNYILTNQNLNLTYYNSNFSENFTFIISKDNFNQEENPYGEEVYEDDLEIKITEETEGDEDGSSTYLIIYINNIEINVKNSIKRKIFKLLETKQEHINRIKIITAKREKEEKLNKSLRNIRER